MTKQHKSTWARERRLDFIDWQLLTTGRAQRADLVRTFDLSVPQAANDFAAFRARYPGAMRYDASRKAYVPTKAPYQTRRGWTPGAVAAMRRLARAGHPMGWKTP